MQATKTKTADRREEATPVDHRVARDAETEAILDEAADVIDELDDLIEETTEQVIEARMHMQATPVIIAASPEGMFQVLWLEHRPCVC